VTDRASRRPFRVLAVAFVGFFLAFAAWSLATPLFAAPDEPVQMMKAVSVVHGELIGSQPEGPSSPYTVVHIAAVYAGAGTVPSCFAFKATVPASCAHRLQGVSTSVPIRIYTGRYPPLYYAVVGLPSLVLSSQSGVYLMRLFSAALNAIFLALAVMAVVTWSRSRLLLVGIAVAATPSALFFGGVINPSGLEISVATCLWCSALVLALERSVDPPKGLVALVGASACVMALVRGLSPLWVGMIGLSVLLLAGRQAALELAKNRMVQIAAGAVVLAGGLALVWIIHAHTLDVLPSIILAPKNFTTGQLLLVTFEHTGRFLREMIGEFGWLDTPSPFGVYVVWFAVIGLLLALAATFARTREVVALVVVLAAAIFVPVVISASQARHAGYVWQGKDSLPFALGVPLVAAQLLGRSNAIERRLGRFAAIVTLVCAGASVWAFLGTMRRYAVGIQGPIWFLSGSWHPPIGDIAAVLLEVVASLYVAALLTGLVQPPRSLVPPSHAARSSGRHAKDLDRASTAGTVDSAIGSVPEGDVSG
jgi:hypothetical protein